MFKDAITSGHNTQQARTPESLSKTDTLTSLWAISESTLGGILHALKFPFRGMIISSAAVILICLIAEYSNKRGRILKSTLLVTIIKAVVSPHTPLTAYLSVMMQGLLGELFFITKRIKFISTMLLALCVAILNGFQKIIILTVIYGETLWGTLNDFLNYIADEWFFLSLTDPVDFSFIIISSYVGIHLIAGIITGIIAFRIPKLIRERIDNEIVLPAAEKTVPPVSYKKSKRRKWLKTTAVLIVIISILIIAISYFFPETDRFDVNAVLLMIARSLLIITIWFYFLAPLLKKKLRAYLTKSRSRYSADVDLIISNIQQVKMDISSVWQMSAEFTGLKRIKYFIITLLAYLLKD